VLGVDLLISVLNGDGLGGSNRLLKLFGESVEIHNLSLSLSTDISISPLCCSGNRS